MIGERIGAFGPVRPESPEIGAGQLPGTNARH
jgi:hypothetical protein